jgi:hypothetical protein
MCYPNTKMATPAPSKGFFTLSEIVILSVVWGSASNLCQGVIKTSLSAVFRGKLGFPPYTADLLVACTLLAATFAMVLLFTNVDVGKRSVFELVDTPVPVQTSDPDGALNYKLLEGS